MSVVYTAGSIWRQRPKQPEITSVDGNGGAYQELSNTQASETRAVCKHTIPH